ncbi:hypothetical protein CspeluHIS016_0106940 [Cutaneotrichosporon spelunceum]|uniref:Uncharacterized protein n=1 Tax=Cutaneotrichosporon spelunceum TaxID=1672016 RepID=A0AAD3TP23_9TREE|nr:hypothetical protein CspeluHIS016_0106940 [Cutaneotrichosporon spelunceum]
MMRDPLAIQHITALNHPLPTGHCRLENDPRGNKAQGYQNPKGRGPRVRGDKPVQRYTEEERADDDVPLPPPPLSVKATASQRLKDKAAAMASPAPQRAQGSQTPAEFDDSEESDLSSRPQPINLFRIAKPAQPVPNLNFRKIAKPRASMAPPPSPGPSTFTNSHRAPRRSMRPDQVLNEHVVPLPPTDTPVIVRNRHLRDKVSRRSSMGFRGARGSSSFDKGEPSYPHSTIPHTQFYKHLPPERPEPQKTSWLISWCGKRALEERTDSTHRKGRERAAKPDMSEIDRLLGDIMDDFSFKLAQGRVDTNVFAPPGESASSMPIKPHPRNVENRKAQERENAMIKKMKDEELGWSHVTSRSNKMQSDGMAALKAEYRPGVEPQVDEVDQASAWFRAALSVADEVLASGGDDIGSAADFGEVEFEVDTLHQASHRANRYAQQSKQFLDGIFSSLAADLRSREGTSTLPPTDSDTPDTVTVLATATGSGSARADPMSMLRALASADAKNPSAEAVSRVQTMGAPRQAAAATPRRSVPRRSVYGRGTPAAR